MLFRKTLFSLVLAGSFVLSAQSFAQPQPVFGYVAQAKNHALTLNGRSYLQLEQSPDGLETSLTRDLEDLARKLNQIVQSKGFKAQDIQPVLVNGQHEIRYREQMLLQFGPAWQVYHQGKPLKTLLELCNQIRKTLGAPALRSYAFLSGSHAHQTGLASWYGGAFHGRLTANGERYNIKAFTAAHKHLPFGTRVLVTNLDSKQSVVVKINDRGPFVSHRIIDLSPVAFKSIGSIGQGVMRVKLTVLN